MTITKEIRLNAYLQMAKSLSSGKALGLSMDNFILLVDNIQFKYGYNDEEMQPIWNIINGVVA